MLKKYNYKNVVCYTYGRKDSFEIENSQKTAKTLNFEWHFIEYKDDLISDFLIDGNLKTTLILQENSLQCRIYKNILL